MGMLARPIRVILAFAVLWLLPTSASAQQLGGQRFTSPADSEDGILGTEGADARMPLRPYVALWLHYALDPVTLRDGNGDEVAVPVEHLVGADLVASLNVWKGLEVGLGVPVTLWSSGDDDPGQLGGFPDAPGVAMGDLTLRVGYRFQLAPHTALALHVPVLLPTSQDDDVLGLGFGARPTLAFLQRVGLVELLFNVSYLIREDEGTLDYEGGQELGARAAARIAFDDQWQTAALAEVGFSTATRDFFSGATTPVEIRGGIEHWFADHWRFTAFLGTGLSRGVGAPDLRAGVGIAYGENPPYRPRPRPTDDDHDGDGILDVNDRCPDEGEDRDGFEDADGCPDDDNDGDGVLDVDDGCRNAPETMNGISDEDGCPDRIRLDDTLITTFEHVQFRSDSDVILERSHPMLDEVAAVLKANPGMRVRIEGHTDDQGDDEYNLELSRRRAQSVRRYLIDKGVDADQVEAEGYGETRPVASNATKAGRRKNRRVEFHIIPEED